MAKNIFRGFFCFDPLDNIYGCPGPYDNNTDKKYICLSNIETNQNLFVGCDNLVGGAGTKKIGSKIEYARIDGGVTSPGYFTAKIDNY
ncbi:MAG: hypothetical protein L6V81_02380 [Clostridium sp.]|nr:MAG: hypothetical protein L6V81_02380 [Clostridium sp.]